MQTIFFCSAWSLCRWTDAVVPQMCTKCEIWGSINALHKFNNVSDSNDLQAFLIIPVPLDIFRDIHFIWSNQFRLLSIITPNNFALPTSKILDPFIWIVGHLSFLPFGLKIMKFVLSIFMGNRLAFNHYIILLSSLLMTVNSSCNSFDMQNNVVSSANKTKKRTRDPEAISLIKKQPTYVIHQTPTIIDNTFTNEYKNENIFMTGILTTDISDHHPVFDIIPCQNKPKEERNDWRKLHRNSCYSFEWRSWVSYTLSREYRVARCRYSRLLFTSEDRFCANLRVQWQ